MQDDVEREWGKMVKSFAIFEATGLVVSGKDEIDMYYWSNLFSEEKLLEIMELRLVERRSLLQKFIIVVRKLFDTKDILEKLLDVSSATEIDVSTFLNFNLAYHHMTLLEPFDGPRPAGAEAADHKKMRDIYLVRAKSPISVPGLEAIQAQSRSRPELEAALLSRVAGFELTGNRLPSWAFKNSSGRNRSSAEKMKSIRSPLIQIVSSKPKDEESLSVVEQSLPTISDSDEAAVNLDEMRAASGKAALSGESDSGLVELTTVREFATTEAEDWHWEPEGDWEDEKGLEADGSWPELSRAAGQSGKQDEEGEPLPHSRTQPELNFGPASGAEESSTDDGSPMSLAQARYEAVENDSEGESGLRELTVGPAVVKSLTLGKSESDPLASGHPVLKNEQIGFV